jgi:hypothetical protein
MNENKKHRFLVMSHRFRSCHKTYFFDVYENKYGSHYLKLTQSIRDMSFSVDNPQYFCETLHIYEDIIYEFQQYFKDAIRIIEEKNKSNPKTKTDPKGEGLTPKNKMSMNDIRMFVKKHGTYTI